MRNLEDCKAEVFRRSEERIKERKKKRNHVLAWCIPLCLLLVVGGLYIRPLFEPVDESMKSGATDRIPDREVGGVDYVLYTLSGAVANYTSVEITDRTGDEALTRKITDTEAMEELCLALMKCSVLPTAGGEVSADGATGVLPENVVTGGTASGEERESDQNTAGTEMDTAIAEEITLKYHLEEKTADYKLVFETKEGDELVFRLYGNMLYNEKTDCVAVLSEAQLTELKTRLTSVIGAGSNEE